ncbi:MAG TPA: A24 family peptidase [Gammaproteobacteria bacterium]|nr:prepilin peptidase [Gammaproteobacteria bacterium]MCW5586839.1 prepilin peptidase [Chromatiales bacterium]HPQ26784.1 A24 family peptidase [Gammaproteobacteria bacterium]
MPEFNAMAEVAPFGALLLGLIVGSFLNVVILRLPRRMHAELAEACADLRDEQAEPVTNRWFGLDYLITPASTCPHCGHAIRAWENIPVLSYLLLRGRCSNCQAQISVRYPLVEALTGLLSLGVVLHFGATPAALAALVLLWGLVALTVIDLDEQLLPDQLTLPLLWLGLLVNIDGLFIDLTSAVIGAAAGYLSLWLVFQVFRLITGREGMGYGDFKLLAVFGAFLGWQMLPLVILLSSLIGAIVGIGLVVLRGRDRQIPIPFGPYLAAAGFVALLWGEQINRSYLQLAGLA